MCRHAAPPGSIPCRHLDTSRRINERVGPGSSLCIPAAAQEPGVCLHGRSDPRSGNRRQRGNFWFCRCCAYQTVALRESQPAGGRDGKCPMIPHANLSYPDYLDWKKLNHVFSSLEVYTGGGYLLRTATGTEPVPGLSVSDGFFHVLGMAPVLGRDFYTGEDLPSAPRTVILSYATWQKRFGGRKDVTGETVALSGIPYAIVGVLPQDFQFALRGDVEFWTTLHASDQCALRRSCHNPNGIGRLKDSVSVEMARAEMKTIARRLGLQHP